MNLFDKLLKGDAFSLLEVLIFVIILIQNNIGFQLTFSPSSLSVPSGTGLATISLAIAINPKLSTSFTIVLADTNIHSNTTF